MKFVTLRVFVTAALLALLSHSALAAGLTIAWDPSDESGVAGYLVKYGEQPHGYGASVDVGQSTTFTVDRLVEGRTYYFTVQAYAADGGVSAMASELSAVVPSSVSTLMAPLDGQTAVTSAQVYQWVPVAHAQAYVFQLGSSRGGHELADSGETLRTWWQVPSLPPGAELYPQVWTRIDGKWTVRGISVVAATASVLTYPIAGTSDTSATETFSWTGVTGAKAYRLSVGTTPGGTDLVDSGETTETSLPVNGLAPGQKLYAQVATKLEDTWAVDAATFTTSYAARFTAPATGDGGDLGRGLAWTTILGADAYYVRIGAAPGGAELLDSGELKVTTHDMPALPAGQPLFAQIATKSGDTWQKQDTTVTLAGAALTGPFADASGAATVLPAGQLFTWTTISNAEGYRLYVGTTPGGTEVSDSGEIHTTSATVAHLPIGTTIYVSVWTKANGVWNGTSSSLLTR